MTARRILNRTLRGVGLAAVIAAAMLTATPAASAKKKGGGGPIDITKAVNAPVPDATPPASPVFFARPGLLVSTIAVGKRGKATKVRDLNVTVQTLGATGTTPATDLVARLTAPNGAQSLLFGDQSGPFDVENLSIGPLTLDDESRLTLGDGAPRNPLFLYQPWAGAATPLGTPLAIFDNSAAAGTWTLTIRDILPGETSSLVSWRLNIVTGKPYQTK